MRSGARRGTAYVFVLGAAALATTAGVAAVTMHGVRLRRVELTRQAQRASMDAQSSLEYLVNVMEQDPLGTTWRTNPTMLLANQHWLGSGGSSINISLADPTDNDLSDSESDPIEVCVSATSGPVSQAFALRMTPVRTALDALDYAVVAKGSVTSSGPGVIYTSGPISQNEAGDRLDSVNAVGSSSTAMSSMTEPMNGGNGGNGGNAMMQQAAAAGEEGATDPPPAVTIPENAIVDMYTRRGTTIPVSTIGTNRIPRLVLGPGLNPYGAVNGDGIYVLDAEGQDLKIENSRIVGTLVIINTGGGGVELLNNVCVEALTEQQPALIVQGKLVLNLVGGDFTEATAGANLNPTGVPDRGVTDSDQSDEYPAHVRGAVFAAGDVSVKGTSTVQGVLMAGGNVEVTGDLRVIHEKPLELIDGMANISGMSMQPGTFTRIVN
jgi:hypothetical protein